MQTWGGGLAAFDTQVWTQSSSKLNVKSSATKPLLLEDADKLIHPKMAYFGINKYNTLLLSWHAMLCTLPWNFTLISFTRINVEGVDLDPHTVIFVALRRLTVRIESYTQ